MNVLEEALKFDALDVAENLTGASYKEDEHTMAIGMGLFLRNNMLKKALLKENKDTCWGCKLNDYIAVVEDLGFRLMYKQEIPEYVTYGEAKGKGTHQYVYWQAAIGILLVFDTYFADSINSGSFYFNWKRNRGSRYQCEGSGSWVSRDLFVGYRDAREALRYNITRMTEEGTFLPIWVKQGYMHFSHHGDDKSSGYDRHMERIQLLPQSVQRAIQGGGVEVNTRKLPFHWKVRSLLRDFLWKLGVQAI